ncbi:MAG: hypothetical protein KGY75_08920, partial [Candidatus Cloacimonetes bacterium]|nr:hypothetical protein [Candidatus Cloacimonadota bacterium]
MKKLFLLISIGVLCFSLAFAHNDFMKKSGNEAVPVNNANLENISHKKINFALPDWEWVTQPYSIMTSWYDYMPSSYESYPLRLQHNDDGGLYYTWHGTPDDGATTNRRQYWAYINAADGSLVDWGTISTQDVWQGYGSIETHPESGAGIATWHQDDATLGYGTTMTYDSYIFNTPGFWASYLFIPPEDDEYIWPYVWVGPSPESGHVRVYQTAKNYEDSPFGNPCEDTRILYCDVENTADPSVLSDLLDQANWTKTTPMYYWREKDCRPQSQCFAIDPNQPGHVALTGFATWLSGDQGDMPINEGTWVWESFDYGTTWDQANLHGTPNVDQYFYRVDNIPGFIVDDEVADDLGVTAGGWHNSARFDGEGNLHWNYLQQYGHYSVNQGGGIYWPNFMPPAEAVWDGSTWTYDEVPEMPGVDPLSGHSVPWEIVGSDTLLYPNVAWSTYEDELFHENTMKNAVNVDNGWMVQMWADGSYITLNALGEPGYEDYATHPIIYLSASNDNGETWSEPIEVTDIYSSEVDFMEQITVYPYLCNKIEDLGYGWGQVHFGYYDDNSFGSFIQGAGQNNGGQIMYGSLKIDFVGMVPGVDNPHNVDVSSVELQNSPNPFNGSTTISFNAPQELRNVEVKIYNTKGQLVRTLTPGNNNEVTWNGKDSNNNNVSNG